MAASTSSVTEPQVQILSSQMRKLGALRDVHFNGLYFNYANGMPQWTFNGFAMYANGTALFNIHLIGFPDGWKVDGFHINPQLRNPNAVPDTVEI